MLEFNKIYHGDSHELITQIDDNSVDAIITDPPYLYLNHKLDRDFNEEFMFKEFYRVLKSESLLCFFGRGSSFYKWCTICSNMGMEFVEELIWDKNMSSSGFGNLMRIHETVAIFRKGKKQINKIHVDKIEYDMNSDNFQNVIANATRILSDLKKLNTGSDFENWLKESKPSKTKHGITAGSNINRSNSAVNQLNAIKVGKVISSIIRVSREHYTMEHPTQKPLALLNILVKLVSNEGEIVIDPFMGSGTTCDACVENKRKTIGFEIDDEYFEIAHKRLNFKLEFMV